MNTARRQAISPSIQALATLALLTFACASPPNIPRVPQFKSTVRAAEVNQSLHDSGGVPKQVASDRETYLADLLAKTSELSKAAGEVGAALRKKADQASSAQLGFNLLGMGASIAAGALSIASPANVVWVAAFSGVAASTAGYQASLAIEGQSRSAVAAVYQDFRTQYGSASLELASATAVVSASLGSNAETWQTAITSAASAFEKVRTVVMFPGLPMASQADIDKYRTELEELRAQLRSNFGSSLRFADLSYTIPATPATSKLVLTAKGASLISIVSPPPSGSNVVRVYDSGGNLVSATINPSPQFNTPAKTYSLSLPNGVFFPAGGKVVIGGMDVSTPSEPPEGTFS